MGGSDVDLTAPVVVLTGAGVSAESGIPTFRDAGGLWRAHRAIDLATPEAFQRNPKLVWEFYDLRRTVIADCQPNAAHLTLAEMERALPDLTLITQNVDGLHQAAGSRNVISLHGDIWRVICPACNHSGEDRRVPLPEIPPRCPRCKNHLRPDVVWFGESLPEGAIEAAWSAFSRAGLMLVVGTSALVQPAASLPMLALQNGARLVEINPASTPLSPYADETLRGPAGTVLPGWWERLQEKA
jgi:NAD-dependent deacetylase